MRIIFFSLSLVLASSAFAQTPAPPPAAKFPTLRVQAGVGTSQKRMGNSSYRKEMTISPKATIEGASRLTPLPAMEATMLVVTMDTRAKYVAGQEAYSIHTRETKSLPEAPNGNARPVVFEESSVNFDSYRDASNLGGAVYKYFVFGITDPATRAIIDFQTNNTQLAALCKAHPEKREEFLGLNKGAKFPASFK